ncbi:MAG: hypothetical protein KJ571_00870 [Bacteroidetes bacterium]|nr:hypothetical protein [Bacteroidota bacterium]
MKNETKYYSLVLSMLLLVFVYSCDFFSPYDVEYISLSKNEIDFSLFENEQQFIVTYADSFDVKWEFEPFAHWITVSKMNGTINIDDPDTVSVKIERSKLKPGSYKENLILNFKNKSDSKKITVKLEMKPILSISNDSLSLGTSDSLATIILSNEGNYPLNWDFNCNEDWVFVQPDTGLLNIDSSKFLWRGMNDPSIKSKSDTAITIKVDKKKLLKRLNSGIVKITSNAGMDSLSLSVYKAEPAKLKISKNKIDFSKDISSNTITIENHGEETLNWKASPNAAWISINPISGSVNQYDKGTIVSSETDNSQMNKVNSAEMEIIINRTGLAPGKYNSKIELASNGGKAEIGISMTVPESPVISCLPDKLDFGDTELLKQIVIANNGTGLLSWTASSKESWITITPSGGSVSNNTNELKVGILRIGLEPGNYSGEININSNGGNLIVPVTFTVPLFPILKINPSILTFTDENNNSAFEISNGGGGILTWHLETDSDWINISTLSGTTTNEIDLVKVSVNTSKLIPGNYTGNIKVSSNFGSEIIKISLVIPVTSKLEFNPASIIFNENQSVSSIDIINSSKIPLEWQLTASQPWIEINPSSGKTNPNSTDKIEVKINKNGLPPGNYSGVINIASSGGNGSVNLSMIINEVPKLKLNSPELFFDSNNSIETIEIQNEGTGKLNWELSSDKTWITFNKKSGSCIPNKIDKVEVNVNKINLAPGQYSGRIQIASNGGNASINVLLTITENIKFSVSPKNLNFRDKDSSAVIEIKNTGDANLIWQASADQPWINILNSSGTTAPKQSDIIDLFIIRDGLAPGKYSGTIKITTNGGEEIVKIDLTITDNIKFSVSPKNINLRDKDSSAVIEIKNTGDDNLIWQASADQPWINILNNSGTTAPKQSGIIDLFIIRDGLTPGKYSGTIKIITNGGEEIVNVDLTITENIKFSVSPKNLNLRDTDSSAVIEIKNTGDANLIWQASADQPWINILNSSGITAPKQSGIIDLFIIRDGLAPGKYSGNIKITTNGGEEIVKIDLTIIANAKLSSSPKNLKFTERDTLQIIEIKNMGDVDLLWRLSENISWLTLSKTEGIIGVKGNDEIHVTIDKNELLPGDYSGKIFVESNGGNESIEVSLKLDGKPKLDLSDNKLNFDAVTKTLSFIIQNTGEGILNWEIDHELDNWLSVDPQSGSLLPSTSIVVNVSIDENLIPNNEKNSKININSNGGNKSILITFIKK